AKTRKEVLKFEGHRTDGTFKSAGKDNYDNAAHQLLFSPNGKFVLSCSRAQAWLWDATTGKPIQALGQKGLSFFRAVFSHDGRWILASILKEESVTCEVGVWDAETGKEVRRLAGSFKGEHLIDHLAVTPSGKHLVACSRDGTIRTWEIESGKEIKRVPVTVKDRLMGFALALDGRLALTWEHKHVKKWTSERIELGGGRFEVRATERPMPEGDPTVYLWDVESGKRIASKPYKGYLGRAVFSPDGQQLLLGDYGPVQMWELVKGVEEKPPQEDPKGPSPKKDAGKTGPAELGSLPKAKGPRLVELAKPPEGVTLQGIYLAGAFERTKRAKDWPQAFPSGTEEVYIVVVFQGLPFGTQVAAEVTAAAGPVRLAPSTVRTIQTGAEIVIELTCAAEKGAYADGDYKTTVLINRTAVAELNWCVGGREPTGNAVALAGTSWQSRYGDGSGYELRFGAGGKLDVLSLSSGSGKSSWKAKKGTWQQNGARFSGFADLDGPKRQRIEVKGRFVDDDLGAKIRNENEGPPGGFGNWYELPLFKKK
ncbi:MAG TPA: hypothetical protein VEL76_38595, partial [Gemmataceae bacterium]|nr:hypothetical protein [Gemmataceae bacterium]